MPSSPGLPCTQSLLLLLLFPTYLGRSKETLRAGYSLVSEAKGDTVLLTLEAGILKRLELKPDDRAEKTSFNLIRK